MPTMSLYWQKRRGEIGNYGVSFVAAVAARWERFLGEAAVFLRRNYIVI